MQTYKILVTGGTSFIGTNPVNELKKRGHEVIACDLLNAEREISKAIRDLKHNPQVTPEEIVLPTMDWMRRYNRVGV